MVVQEEGLPLPTLMHSNFTSTQEVLAAAALPERIRPKAVGFGTLMDGFLPFIDGDGTTHDITLASIVMKGVQAWVEGHPPPSQVRWLLLG